MGSDWMAGAAQAEAKIDKLRSRGYDICMANYRSTVKAWLVAEQYADFAERERVEGLG